MPPPTNTVSTAGAPVISRGEVEFAAQTFHPRLRRRRGPQLAGRVGVEIAVSAAGGTERHVD